MSARQSPPPAAHVNPDLRRAPDFFSSSGAAAVPGVGYLLSEAREATVFVTDWSAQGLTVATIRYPSRGTVAM